MRCASNMNIIMTSPVYWRQRGGHTQVGLFGPPESTVNWPGRRREEGGSELIAHIRVIQVLPVADNWIDEDGSQRAWTRTWSNRLRPATFRLLPHMRNSLAATLSKSCSHFSVLWVEIALKSPPYWERLFLPGKTNIAIHGSQVYVVGSSTARHLPARPSVRSAQRGALREINVDTLVSTLTIVAAADNVIT